MVEEQAAPEESGWTSYLRCPTLSQLSDSSFTSPQCAASIDTTSVLGLGLNSDLQVAPNATLKRHVPVASQKQILHLHDIHDQLAAHDYNPKDVADALSMHCLSDHEDSCGSSTLSDANSSLDSHPQQRKQLKRKWRRHCNSKFDASAALPTDLLEDTAISSPCSDQASKCNQPDYFACDEEGNVSKRFKALQVLIPGLKEMEGKEKEEEMLGAIITHVRALEQKVQVLLDVWHLTQLNHGLSPLHAHVKVD